MKILIKPFTKARLKLKLEGDVEFYELIQKCEEYLRVGQDFGKTRFYDKKGRLCVEVLTAHFSGVCYQISITNQEISIYAKNLRNVDEKRIALKIKELLYALSEMVDCLEYYERVLHVKKATFTRYYEDGNELVEENNILTDAEIEMDGEVGMIAKCNSTTDDFLIFKSYFTDTNYNYSFFNNTSLCFDMLFDVFNGSDVLSYS